MRNGSGEREHIRDLAKRYIEYATSPEIDARRRAWAAHNALRFTRPLIYIRAIPFHEFFDEGRLTCEDPLFRSLERLFLQAEYRRGLADDFVFDPYHTLRASVRMSPQGIWGLPMHLGEKPAPYGAAAYAPSIVAEEDIEKLQAAPHAIDEADTQARAEPVYDAIGDIMPLFIDREGALSQMWNNDISCSLAKLRGLEQIMWDAYDRPEWMHRLLSKMQQHILANMDETERAGDYSLANHRNQAMPFADGLEYPDPSAYGVKPSQLWGYAAAQEFTTFGPAMFDEFMFSYQKPILERYALSAYGCCEDLTNKIGVISELRNLRRIAVSPFADLKKCAEQIGERYILSWRPNPSSMVSFGVDEDYIRRFLKEGFDVLDANGCKFDITLKDVETVSGDAQAIIKWTRIVREEIEKRYGA